MCVRRCFGVGCRSEGVKSSPQTLLQREVKVTDLLRRTGGHWDSILVISRCAKLAVLDGRGNRITCTAFQLVTVSITIEAIIRLACWSPEVHIRRQEPLLVVAVRAE